ncbi:hypothetical protein OsJ_19051 [Oryza sativa Japonica Group]|uniref:RING-type E3 ubiquitin transferase n=1 Tax=Oryza sativa subsp. japonica TaxID=39947 RepID=B9FK73_ORYSJ|nr:hypothetical protein OsJ_19051 [Oryza sativa Japonica Group]
MSNRATHWCYVCRRPVRIRGGSQDVTCPSCDDGFVQEMSEMGRRTASSTLGFVGPDAGDEFLLRRSPVMEAMSTLMRHAATVGGDEREVDVHDEHGGGDCVPAHARLGVLFRGGPRVGVERRGGYYRAGLEALFEQLQNQLGSSRQGPPPAPPSAIDAMPVVTISRRELRGRAAVPGLPGRVPARRRGAGDAVRPPVPRRLHRAVAGPSQLLSRLPPLAAAAGDHRFRWRS